MLLVFLDAEITVDVQDQLDDFFEFGCDLVRTDCYGVYHATNEGFCSWADFAKEIMKQANLPCRVKPITSAEYPQPVKRPANSRLSKASLDAAGFDRLPTWQNALSRFLAELAE